MNDERGHASWPVTARSARAQLRRDELSAHIRSQDSTLLPTHERWRSKRDPHFSRSVDANIQIGAVHMYPPGYTASTTDERHDLSDEEFAEPTNNAQQHDSRDLGEGDPSGQSSTGVTDSAVRQESEIAEVVHAPNSGRLGKQDDRFCLPGVWADMLVGLVTASVVIAVVCLFSHRAGQQGSGTAPTPLPTKSRQPIPSSAPFQAYLYPTTSQLRLPSDIPTRSGTPSITTAAMPSSPSWEAYTQIAPLWLQSAKMTVAVAFGGSQILAVGSTFDDGTVQVYNTSSTDPSTMTLGQQLYLGVFEPKDIILRMSDDGLWMAVAATSRMDFGLVQVYSYEAEKDVWSLEAEWGSASDGFGSVMDLSGVGEKVVFVSQARRSAKVFQLRKGQPPQQIGDDICLSCEDIFSNVDGHSVAIFADYVVFGRDNGGGVAVIPFGGAEPSRELFSDGIRHFVGHGFILSILEKGTSGELLCLDQSFSPFSTLDDVGTTHRIDFGRVVEEEELFTATVASCETLVLGWTSRISVYTMDSDRKEVLQRPGASMSIEPSRAAPQVAVSADGQLLAVRDRVDGDQIIRIFRQPLS